MPPRAFLAPILNTALTLLLLALLHHALTYPAVQHADLAIQLRLHALANPTLTRIMLAFTGLGAIITFAPALALVLAWLLLRGRRYLAILLAAALTGALVLNESLKLLFHRPRPSLPWSLGDEHTFSFPSGHSLFSVVLYGTLAYVALQHPASPLRRAGILVLATALPLAIGTSRIYLGMHYPTDVLAGFIAGTLWLTAVIHVDHTLTR